MTSGMTVSRAASSCSAVGRPVLVFTAPIIPERHASRRAAPDRPAVCVAAARYVAAQDTFIEVGGVLPLPSRPKVVLPPGWIVPL